ncbi:MAG: hypothetical protein GWN79_18205, partial [Actinobacteria bacterium]|nr:hypothetical protein [Actinomycetota bacterium]NIS34035.1 hypothetical protein [Actinomycetota bacterium]NIT97210.1 hypothetical protein [Actinomycetota bacterium]NIU20887.1 hypothetical protein [Actinomycetota bacterium]NIU68841.1 hypothetical protein [Actinomycetota bacterium]
VRAHRALSELDDPALARLRATGLRTAEVVRIHGAVATRLRSGFSDEQDLVDAAVSALAGPSPVLDQLGPAIVFLPQRLTSSQTRLLTAVGDRGPLHVVAGVTGVERADDPVRTAVVALGGEWPDPGSTAPATADAALSVSDADDEVRHAVREIMAAALDGVPLGRCAVLYGNADPYGRLIA